MKKSRENTELVIKLFEDHLESSLLVDGVVRQKIILPPKKEDSLIAWMGGEISGSIHARLRVSGRSQVRRALDLALKLTRAGHFISVGEICQFRPADLGIPSRSPSMNADPD